jgi:23S rRNA pseudouridine2605 synthase
LTPRRPPPSLKPPTSPLPAERLQKRLAAAGYGSRREIEGWIRAGRLRVNGQTAQLGMRAGPSDHVELDGQPLELGAGAREPRVLAYHKPEGVLVTRADPEGRPTVFERLPPVPGGKWVAVGRLDVNTSGLLLLTDSGDLANRLMHPRYEVEREYLARILGPLTPAERSRLLSGVALSDGMGKFDRLSAEGSPEGANRWYRVVLREGRNREVRRLFEALGHPVSRLRRVRYGPVALPRDLRPGQWRALAGESLAEIVKTAKRG